MADPASKAGARPVVRIALGVAVAGVVAIGVWALWPSSPTGRADPDDAAQVALGQVVYRESCASCHGVRLEGQPDWRSRKPNGRLPAPPHDQNGHTFHHPDENLFRIVKLSAKSPLYPKGYESDMPDFGDTLTDDQIWAVLAFIKSTWPPMARERQERIDQASRNR
jgi:mono/diheme cytochrome c family protein